MSHSTQHSIVCTLSTLNSDVLAFETWRGQYKRSKWSCQIWLYIVLSPYSIHIYKDKVLHNYTHCHLMVPYGDTELGQHWLRRWLVAWQYQAISWIKSEITIIQAMQNSPESNIINDARDISLSLKSLYSALSIYRGHFSSYNSWKTSHISPVRARDGVSFVSANLTKVSSL